MNTHDREMVVHYIREAMRIAEKEQEAMLAYILDLALEEANRGSKMRDAPLLLVQ